MTSLSDIVLKIGDSIKFRHLGIGFVWAWIYCSFETSALYPDRSGVGINADISWLASAASVTFCLFAFGFFFRFHDLSNRKTFLLSLRCLWRAARSLRRWRATGRPLGFCRV